LNELKGTIRKLSTKFWTKFHTDFPLLTVGISSLLPDPPAVPLSVRATILDGISQAHDENPALRKTAKFELALELLSGEALNETELLGLIQGSEESPIVSIAHSTKMRVCIMELFARHIL
jgi:hypothetical protein